MSGATSILESLLFACQALRLLLGNLTQKGGYPALCLDRLDNRTMPFGHRLYQPRQIWRADLQIFQRDIDPRLSVKALCQHGSRPDGSLTPLQRSAKVEKDAIDLPRPDTPA